MGPMYFKLKYNGHIRLVDFKGLPNWSELFAKLQTLYNLPVDKLGICYIDKDDEEITVSSNEELQRFYRSVHHTYQTFNVNVVDLSIPSEAENVSKKRRRVQVPELDIIEIWQDKTLTSGFPMHPRDVVTFLLGPLQESEKIPMSRVEFDRLISFATADICSKRDLERVFVAGNVPSIYNAHFVKAVQLPPSATGTTKATYHGFWDNNIRDLLEILIPDATSLRGVNNFTENEKGRPDYTLIIKSKCPFRGEEKAPVSVDDPKAGLVNKLIGWKYAPAPYILGYYAVGSSVTFVAIVGGTGAKASAVDLITRDLKLRKHRVENIGIILKLSVVIRALQDIMGLASINEYMWLSRPNCIIDLSGNRVNKEYTCADARARVAHLKVIYGLLHTKKVPHTDELKYAHSTSVVLSPRGIEREPEDDKDLRNAISYIVEALKVAHDEPSPLFHRDIRWNNVLHQIEDPNKWFLIDWEDSSLAPTKAASLLNEDTHSPDVFKDNHGAEVDIWGVGFLIRSCQSQSISTGLRALCEDICRSPHQFKVEDLLEHIQNA